MHLHVYVAIYPDTVRLCRVVYVHDIYHPVDNILTEYFQINVSLSFRRDESLYTYDLPVS
jgi:hypothetical protein